MLAKRFGPVQGILAVKGEGVQRNLLNFTDEGLSEKLLFYWLI